MNCTTRKLRSPLKWHGGKSYLARRIIGLMPEHTHYLELFAGGLSILLNKTTPGTEMVNDAHPGIINFWRYLRDNQSGELLRMLRETPYSAESFSLAKALPADAQAVEKAWAFMVRNRMSRGGLGKDFAWSDRLRGGQPGDVNAWQTILADLDVIHRRLQKVDILGLDYTDALSSVEVGPDTLVYADPPYLPETRSVKKAYECELFRAGHVFMLEKLLACKGIVLISGYRSDLYDSTLSGWTRHEFDLPNHSGQGATKQRRIECVWINR